MLAVFTVSVGYGVVLPFLPGLLGRLAPGLSASGVSRDTGLLTGVYALALFLCAPVWGRVSDRWSRRGVVGVGLLGFSGTSWALASVDSIAGLYAGRFLSGVFASAVTPVAAAAAGDFAGTEQNRVRRLTLISMAGVAGVLLGPAAGALAFRFSSPVPDLAASVGALASAFTATALLALLAGLAVAAALRHRHLHQSAPGGPPPQPRHPAVRGAPGLLRGLAFIVSAAIGVFEVGVALRARQELGFSPVQIALMFGECSLVMVAMQAIVFSPWVKPKTTGWLIAPALAVLAAGLLLVPRISDFPVLIAVIGAVAGSAGILSPSLTYWISATAGRAQGWELGRQTAANSLGILTGSVAGGLLSNVTGVPGVGFVLTAGLALTGAGLSLRLPGLLVRR